MKGGKYLLKNTTEKHDIRPISNIGNYFTKELEWEAFTEVIKFFYFV